jgi:RHS repeat-associated protein
MQNIGQKSARLAALESDSETGLYYYRARYYDPAAGRFLNEDPLGFMGGINKYGFVRNSPLNWVDRFGTSASSCECQEPNRNRMSLSRRMSLVGFGSLHVILGGSKIGLALGAEAETVGLATPIAGYFAVQGAGNFVQGMTEILAGAVGDPAGEALVSSAGSVTTSLSIFGPVVSAMSHNSEAAGAAKSYEGLLSALVFEQGNIPIILMEAADTIHEAAGVVPKKCQGHH